MTTLVRPPRCSICGRRSTKLQPVYKGAASQACPRCCRDWHLGDNYPQIANGKPK